MKTSKSSGRRLMASTSGLSAGCGPLSFSSRVRSNQLSESTVGPIYGHLANMGAFSTTQWFLQRAS